MIDKKVKNEWSNILGNWDSKGHAWAKRELQKMFLKYYYKTNNIESKRLILHNLIIAEIELKTEEDMKLAKEHSKILLEDMDKVNFDIDHPALYCRVLQSYVLINEKDMSKSERIENYEYLYNLTKKSEVVENDTGYLSIMIAKFNLYLHKEDAREVLNIIKEMSIHTNNSKYEKALEQMMEEVRLNLISFYKEAQKVILQENITIA